MRRASIRALHSIASRLLVARRLESTQTSVSTAIVTSASEVDEVSPFLSSLIDPPMTVPLEDAARTYNTMDVVEPLTRYDPSKPNISSTLGDEEVEDVNGVNGNGPIVQAHRAGRLWSAFHGMESSMNKPPAWFVQLCEDLFYRRHGEDDMDAVAAASSDFITEPARGDESEEVDPYLWLPFDLLAEADYNVGPYSFVNTATYTHEQRTSLCLGNTRREYVHFCNTYAFPDRVQIPTSVGTQPARLYVDPQQKEPVVYIQLSEDFPPAMWLPVKGTAAAVRRVLAEFASIAALHRDWHHAGFEERFATSVRLLQLQQMPSSDGDILRFMAYEARNTQFAFAPIREFPNQKEFFLGEYDDPERLLEHLDLCPFLFAIPHMRTVTDLHAEHMTPTIEGPGVATSLYRCIFSKALLFVQVQLSAEVKLPPQDQEAFRFMWKDSEVVPKMRIPVFIRVVWPDNERMCGGGQLVRRFNRLFKTEFAPDTPVDAVMALFYIMQWANQLPNFFAVCGMRRRVAELETAAKQPEPPLLYPGTREIPNPEYTIAERLGMHIQYLAQLNDPDISSTIQRILPEASAPVRMGCAKAALIAGERELFRRIVSSEPAGRMQTYMTKLVRKRKTRDIVDPEPRLLEEQYEFAAPLWTKRGTRLDANTLEGAIDMQARIGTQ